MDIPRFHLQGHPEATERLLAWIHDIAGSSIEAWAEGHRLALDALNAERIAGIEQAFHGVDKVMGQAAER